MQYERGIDIAVDTNVACDFLKRVENLPVWTRFFKKCESVTDNIGDMQTVLGSAKTHIRQDSIETGTRLRICSQFKERNEEAVVTITKDANAKSLSKVTFCLKVPEHFSQEQQMKMVTTVEEELRFLKTHLESQNG